MDYNCPETGECIDLTLENLGIYIRKLLLRYHNDELGLDFIIQHGISMKNFLEAFVEKDDYLSLLVEINKYMYPSDKKFILLHYDVEQFEYILDHRRDLTTEERWRFLSTYVKYRPPNIDYSNVHEYLKELLRQYSEGMLEIDEVMNHGEAIDDYLCHKYYDRENLIYPECVDDDAHENLVHEAIEYIADGSMLHNFVILPSDVQYFIKLLDTPKGQVQEGIAKFQHYIENLKIKDRLHEEEKMGMVRHETGFSMSSSMIKIKAKKHDRIVRNIKK
jgi:hypothetical protein